jgi:phage terminase large subunit-like protein
LPDFLTFAPDCGITLEPYQRKIAKAIQGPERECIVLVPRDNGKSFLAATVALYWLVTGTEDVFCAATSRDQAHLVLTYAKRAARELGDPHVVERFHDLRFCPDPSKPSQWSRQFRALPADAGKLHGLKGRWIIDELHAARDDEVYLAARTSSERASTKLMIISTAAASADSTLGRIRARALSSPDVKRRGALTDARGDNIRLLEWAVDHEVPIGDMRAAKRANPASWITTDSLRRLRDAVPETSFRRYHRNEHAAANESAWLPTGAWAKCRADYGIEPGERIFVGVDLGGTRALSAVSWVTDDLRVGTKSYRGEEGPLFCQSLIEELAAEYQVVEVAADPWRAAPMLLELGQRGIRVLDWPQSNERACPASQRLRELIVEGKLRQPGDEDLDRAVALAIARQVPRGWRIDRPGGRGARDEPIDPLVALMMSVERAVAPRAETKLLGWL